MTSMACLEQAVEVFWLEKRWEKVGKYEKIMLRG